MSKKPEPIPGKGKADDADGEGHLPPRPKPKGGDGKTTITVMDKSGVKRKVKISRTNKSFMESSQTPSLPPPPTLVDKPKAEEKSHPKEDEVKAEATTEPAKPHPHKTKEVKKEPPTEITKPPHPHHKKKVSKEEGPPATSDVEHKHAKRHPKVEKSESRITLDSTSTKDTTDSSSLFKSHSNIVPESKEHTTPKKRRRKVLKGSYKKFFDLSALHTELEDSGSSVSESDSSEKHQGEEDSSHPDMNWISMDDEAGVGNTNVNVGEETLTAKKARDIPCNRILDPYLWTCLGLGRLPFKFKIDKRTGAQICTMPRKSLSFVIFVVTTIIMTVALVTIAVSIINILNSEVETESSNKTNKSGSSEYARLEILLIHHWWLPISIFVLSLIMVIVGSFSVIVSGPSMAAYITLWIDTMNHFSEIGYTTHNQNLRRIAWAHPISTCLNLFAILCFCVTELFSLQEPIQTITVLLLRGFRKELYFDLGRIKGAKATNPSLYYLVAVFMAYVFFSARSFVVIIIIFCRGIAYLAAQWNIRLMIILRKLSPAKVGLEKMKPLKYEDMLSDHQKIVVLVSGISGTFSTVVVMYALAEFCKLFTALFASSQDLAIATHQFNSTYVEHTTVRYDRDAQDEWFEVLYHLSNTVMAFGLVSWGVTTAGDYVMAGFDTVRRHGLLLSKGVKERKFIMSLTMSFNNASPHVICPGNWFLFDRGFIFSVFCGAVAIYSLLIQLTIVHKVDVPIIFTCTQKTTGNKQICFGSTTENKPAGSIGVKDRGNTYGDEVMNNIVLRDANVWDVLKPTTLLKSTTSSPDVGEIPGTICKQLNNTSEEIKIRYIHTLYENVISECPKKDHPFSCEQILTCKLETPCKPRLETFSALCPSLKCPVVSQIEACNVYKTEITIKSFKIQLKGIGHTIWRLKEFNMAFETSKSHENQKKTCTEQNGKSDVRIESKNEPRFRHDEECNFFPFDDGESRDPDFDDCGNLPFSLNINIGGKKYKQETEDREDVSSNNREPYKCYKSPIPGYQCGVPKEHVDDACELWQKVKDTV